MGYDPSTYEKAPTEDENTNNTQNNDELGLGSKI